MISMEKFAFPLASATLMGCPSRASMMVTGVVAVVCTVPVTMFSGPPLGARSERNVPSHGIVGGAFERRARRLQPATTLIERSETHVMARNVRVVALPYMRQIVRSLRSSTL